MVDLLTARRRNLNIALAQFKTKDTKSAIETTIALNDKTVLVDILSIFHTK